MPSLSPHPKPCWDAQGWRRPEGHFQPLTKVSVLCPGWLGPKGFGSRVQPSRQQGTLCAMKG